MGYSPVNIRKFALEDTKMTENRKSEGHQNPKKPRFGRAAASRYHCIDCSNWKIAEVRKCKDKHCPLWEFRMGSGRTEPLEDDIPVHGRDKGRF